MSAVSPRLAAYFKDYASYHRTHGNELCHYVGIPLIVLSLFGLFSGIRFGLELTPILRLDLGIVLWIGAATWSIAHDWRLGTPFSLITLGSYFLGRALSPPWLWSLFILGWVFQMVGHYRYEKRSPAFYKNLEHLFVGPLWIFARILHRA
jgi:uncharacterized membrane protein YGL010W